VTEVPERLESAPDGNLESSIERRLEAVLDNSTALIFLMDHRQQCIYMNRQHEQDSGGADRVYF
jgi:PAS domain-containing protein